LKTNIPIQTRHDAAKTPGYVQTDTVAHCGSNIKGAYVHTLTVTDIHSNWTENRAVWRKDSDAVIHEYMAIEKMLPFIVLCYSSDNGGEVINEKIWNYLNSKGVTITRGRPYRKNDNPHVEQKNNTHVRKLLGYKRFDHRPLVKLMNQMYQDSWNPLQNFFTPSQKLIKKVRVGARIIKTYDKPRTPYQRLMRSKALSSETKANLKRKYESLNPIYLSQKLDEEKKQFFKTVHMNRQTSAD
jgi:hypothetical protein